MYHSIKFIREEDMHTLADGSRLLSYTKDTYEDWNLVPTKRPSVNPPTPKTNYIDIPGADSQLDFSTALTGYPVYNNREGSWQFMIDHDKSDKPWYDIYSEIMDWLQGEKMCCILDDDQSWYYTGRFYVSAASSEQKYTTIDISYTLEPYKHPSYLNLQSDDWIWDYFDFQDGILMMDVTRNITVNSNDFTKVNWDIKNINEWYACFGRQPVIPTIVVTSTSPNTVQLRFQNSSLHKQQVTTEELPSGLYSYRNIIFGGKCLVQFIPEYYPGTNWKIGDVNRDGKIDSRDASLLLQKIADNDFDERDRCVCDTNLDSKINQADASLILSKLQFGNYLLNDEDSLKLEAKGQGTISFKFIPGRL